MRMASPAAALHTSRTPKAPGRLYPIRLMLSYSAYRNGDVIQRGAGQTIEMSSTRIRIKSAETLDPSATEIKLSIAWPIPLEDGTGLQFVVQGRPAWDEAESGTVLIASYEFRTAPKNPINAADAPSAAAPGLTRTR